MKKLLLVSLICILVFSFTAIAFAINLTMWSGPYYLEKDKESGWYINRVIGEFEELYPEVNIELEILPWTVGADKRAIGIATHTTSDILLGSVSAANAYAQQGVICDLEDIMTAEEKADYLPGYIEELALDGKMYMYIVTGIYGTGEMGINKVLVEKAGAMDLLPLDRPYRNWTVDEYKIFCQAMTKYLRENNLNDIYTTVFAFGSGDVNQATIARVFQAGWGVDPLEVVNGRYRCILNSPKAVEALQWYLDFYNDPTCGMKQGAESQLIDWR